MANGEIADHKQVVLYSTAFSYVSTILTQITFNLSMSFLQLFKAAYRVNRLKNIKGISIHST